MCARYDVHNPLNLVSAEAASGDPMLNMLLRPPFSTRVNRCARDVSRTQKQTYLWCTINAIQEICFHRNRDLFDHGV